MLFIIVSLLELLGELINYNDLVLYTKPLLMPTLFIEYSYYNNDIIIWNGLLYAWIGDILLLNKNDSKFLLLGMSSFMITHLSYIYYFYVNNNSWTCIYVIPLYIGTSYVLEKIIKPISSSILTFGVVLYTIILMTMFYFSLLYQNYMVIIGAGLFVVSDTMIGFNISRQYKYQNLYNFFIMGTYLVGQYLLINNLRKN
jgi:uncharacterized membrane protein YhhN